MGAVDFRPLGRPATYALLAAGAVLPRLGVLLYERGDIVAANVDKGDDFARTLLASGTYGFIPDIPSAYTQPLYGFFLAGLYWLFERSWSVIGLAHVGLALATAILVYELGRRFVSAPVGLVAALMVALEPYLVWHDVHMNREVLDGLLAASVAFATLALAARPSPILGIAAGVVAGVAVLGNVRLAALPLALACFVVVCARRAAFVPALAFVVAAAVVVTPWVVRNRVSVGCLALTTDARALWKANNPATLSTLRAGGWIDQVPPIPGAPPTPQDVGELYRETGRIVRVDECAQMRFYRRRAVDFIVDHPGEKTKLAALATRMLWQPAVTRTEDRPAQGGFVDTARTWVQGPYVTVLYALAVIGLAALPRRVLALGLLLLAYATVSAMVFAGETRYRVPWDFLIALSAAAAAVRIASRDGWPARRAIARRRA
jgi:hypothetical protein